MGTPNIYINTKRARLIVPGDYIHINSQQTTTPTTTQQHQGPDCTAVLPDVLFLLFFRGPFSQQPNETKPRQQTLNNYTRTNTKWSSGIPSL
jgi:hypothetical protein